MRAVIAGLALLISITSAEAAGVVTSDIGFGQDGRYHGYLARPSGHGPFPGIVVIHEWWRLNDNIRRQSSILAQAGYVALAVDLFGKVAADPQEAQKLVQGLDQKAATEELLAATNYLRSQPFVRHDRIGSIGWCFGGGQSLTLALHDPKLRAAVIYYGHPITGVKELSKIHAAILGIFGEADQSIPMATVHEFDAALTQAKVKHEIHTYPGAGHAFANPSGGDRYKPEAAKDAWKRTMDFLAKHLKR